MKTINYAHAETIEPKLQSLHKKLSSLGVHNDLFHIIRRPGWTTPAELHFVHNLIDQIEFTQALLVKQLKALHEGSNMIK